MDLRCLISVLSLLALTACNLGGGRPGPSPAAPAPEPGEATEASLWAQILRTEFGIPHIIADDFAGFGYGYGYVHTEDNLCVLAEDLMTIRGERARFFGRDGRHVIIPNGSVASNVDSDFFWKAVATDEAIAPLREKAEPEARDATLGFVAGYNRYLRELRAGEHPGRHADCRDAEWIGPITEADMYRRYYRLALIASSSVFVEGIATAAPPSADNPALLAATPDEIAALDPADFPLADGLDIGSNMYALGPEATADGSSMLFGNPHFPWIGPERLYLAHGIVGDDVNIMGSALYGVPAALIGFNEHFAWSHTVSTAFRFTFYELTLNPADPTQYLYDGEIRDMQASEISVDVLEDDGSISTQTRTLYRSHYGPMLEFQVSGVPVLEWSDAKAYTLRDANAENDRLINQFFEWNQAQSLDEFIELHASVLGVPWVNTVATGPGQPAYYGDVTVVPNVPDAKTRTCGAQPLHEAFQQLVPGLPVLDGSRSACEWDSDDDAPAPGIFGPENLPKLTRADWVHNCNDSHWLTNPAEPITGYAAIIGPEETPRSLRTRLCALQVIRRLEGSDGLPGDKFSYEQLQQIVLDSQVYTAQLERDNILGSYCPFGTLLGSAGPVDISGACEVLANWDLKNNLDSVGGHLWREFWRNVNGPGSTVGLDTKWLTPFSADAAVNTPRDLNPLDPAVETAFADAVQTVMDSPFELDTPMGQIQHSGVHDPIPVFGGEGFEGSFTIANARGTGLTENGYEITYGNSHIQAVTWAPDTGEPRAEGFITYSQSTDPASPYFQDLTQAYSDKRWVAFPFTAGQLESATVLESYKITE